MAKQSKRTRKFAATGGVQARLQRGTITNKGKAVLKRKKQQHNNKDAQQQKRAKADHDAKIMSSTMYGREQRQKKEDADLLSEKNLGDLDMESFFESVVEGGDDDADDNDDNDDDDSSSEDDDDDDEEPMKSAKTSSTAKKPAGNSSSSDSDSNSEEEDVEEAEREMKEALGKLQSQDPEFHEFLKENEESLLDYGEEANVDDEDNDDNDNGGLDQTTHTKNKKAVDEGDDYEDETEVKDKKAESDGSIPLTQDLLAKLERGAFESHGVKALKKIVNAFRCACHLADGGEKEPEGRSKYIIESSVVFDRLMLVSLTKCSDEFHYHLVSKGATKSVDGSEKDAKQQEKNQSKAANVDEAMDIEFDPNKPINPKVLERANRWGDVNPILSTYLKSAMHILAEAKDPALVTFVLKALSNYLVFMTPFPRLTESMLKTLTSLWSAPIDSSEDYQVVRLHSFLRIRQLAITQPFPFIEECLKKLYLAYAQRAKFATGASVTSTLPTLTFMGNCVVELYSLDYHSSYQHAFIYIRQLALHLRTAMQKKSQEAMAAVYCWQFMHCLKLWVAVLTEASQPNDGTDLSSGEEELLRSLIFPLSQVILGTARLIPSTRYLPLRLHCVRLLQQLAAAAVIFLPTTSILLEVFDLNELSQPPKKTSKASVNPLALTLRLQADNPLRSMEESEMCISEVFVLLNREIDLYRYSAAFPEFSVRIVQRLKKVSLILYDVVSY